MFWDQQGQEAGGTTDYGQAGQEWGHSWDPAFVLNPNRPIGENIPLTSDLYSSAGYDAGMLFKHKIGL